LIHNNFVAASDERGGVLPIYGKWVCLWPYMATPQRHGFLD